MLPTWRTWLALLVTAGLAIWAAAGAWYPFLAVEETFPDDGAAIDLLCVEGWSSESALDAAAEAYRSGKYARIAVTGGPTQSRERFIGFSSYAALGAHRLEQRGVSGHSIVVSEPAFADRRRTFNDIMELRRTLHLSSIEPRRVQVLSTSVHTRRTRMLYRRIFGDAVEIRARALAPEDYDPQNWWNTSDGLKSVVMETISYLFDALAPTPETLAENPVNLTVRGFQKAE